MGDDEKLRVHKPRCKEEVHSNSFPQTEDEGGNDNYYEEDNSSEETNDSESMVDETFGPGKHPNQKEEPNNPFSQAAEEKSNDNDYVEEFQIPRL